MKRRQQNQKWKSLPPLHLLKSPRKQSLLGMCVLLVLPDQNVLFVMIRTAMLCLTNLVNMMQTATLYRGSVPWGQTANLCPRLFIMMRTASQFPAKNAPLGKTANPCQDSPEWVLTANLCPILCVMMQMASPYPESPDLWGQTANLCQDSPDLVLMASLCPVVTALMATDHEGIDPHARKAIDLMATVLRVNMVTDHRATDPHVSTVIDHRATALHANMAIDLKVTDLNMAIVRRAAVKAASVKVDSKVVREDLDKVAVKAADQVAAADLAEVVTFPPLAVAAEISAAAAKGLKCQISKGAKTA